MRANVADMWGTIIGNWKTHLFVLFDGEITYYDDKGNVVRSYQKGNYAV
ncbi:Hypothetical protein BCRIVMBC120_02654 [Bacillus wiedmannii]|nr:Hypothetical protein BCRIVMBC120_02654 [Bacillus wiedmannii]